jgi:hypothetical protein
MRKGARHLAHSSLVSCLLCNSHNSGKAASKNSGFGGDGGWDANPDVLNNGYYNELIDISQFGLDFEENTAFPPFPNQFYWEEEVPEGAPDGTFMLHADMALAFDMEGFLDSETGNVACTLVQTEGRPVCPVSPLLPQAVEYANDNDQWVADFKAAYLKMVSTGCGDGACDPV